MKRETFFLELFRQFVIMLYGGFIYGAVEILYRGHTHPSMFILGGLSLVWVGGLNCFFRRRLPIPVQMAIGSVIITLGEFVCGMIVNVGFGMHVWDYSKPLRSGLPAFYGNMVLFLVCRDKDRGFYKSKAAAMKKVHKIAFNTQNMSRTLLGGIL